jgi:hypothetical protein
MRQYDQARVIQQRDEELRRRNILVDAQIKEMQEKAEWRKTQLAQGRDPDSPSSVREWEYFNQLPPDKQGRYLDMKRASPMIAGMPWSDRGMGLQPKVDPENVAEILARQQYLQSRATGQGKLETTYEKTTDAQGRPAFTPADVLMNQIRGGSAFGGGRLPGVAGLPPQMREAMRGVQVPGPDGTSVPVAQATAPRPIEASAPAMEKEKLQAQAEGKEAGAQSVRAMKAPELLNMLDEAEKLVPEATGSLVGWGRDVAVGSLGYATPGAKANAELQPIAGRLLSAVPRFEGPQSDRDVTEYKNQAGDLANPRKTAGEKLAAIKSMRSLAEKYRYKHGETRQTKDGRTAYWDTSVGKWRVD